MRDVTAPTVPMSQRQWPTPKRPWLIAQEWSDLLFAHWRLPVEVVAPLIPPGLELELWEGGAWVGIVPFHAVIHPRFVPSVLGQRFLEVNVRTYVTRGGKPGVWFFSLDAESALAVTGARAAFHLPYFRARMTLDRGVGGVAFHSTRQGGSARFSSQYRAVGPSFLARRGTLESWLVERYCLYAKSPTGIERTEIDHPAWALHEGRGTVDAGALLAAAGLPTPASAPLLHVSTSQVVKTWWPEQA